MIGSPCRVTSSSSYADQQIDDPDGILLPADTAAIEYARRIINVLRQKRWPEEPEPSIAVENVPGEALIDDAQMSGR
jgi:hypothetical protein